MANKRRLLGTILIDMKAISLNDLRVALAHFDHLRDGRLGQYLVTCGLIKQIQLKLALRQQEKESASLQINRAVSLNNPEKPVSISDALIKIGAVTEPELDHVLADFDPGRHGYCGNYLVTCGLITQKQLHTALLQQLSGVMAAQHVEPEDEPCVASRFATGRPVLRILK